MSYPPGYNPYYGGYSNPSPGFSVGLRPAQLGFTPPLMPSFQTYAPPQFFSGLTLGDRAITPVSQSLGGYTPLSTSGIASAPQIPSLQYASLRSFNFSLPSHQTPCPTTQEGFVPYSPSQQEIDRFFDTYRWSGHRISIPRMLLPDRATLLAQYRLLNLQAAPPLVRDPALRVALVDDAGVHPLRQLARNVGRGAGAMIQIAQRGLLHIGMGVLEIPIEERQAIYNQYRRDQEAVLPLFQRHIANHLAIHFRVVRQWSNVFFPAPFQLNGQTIALMQSARFAVPGVQHPDFRVGFINGMHVSPQEALGYARLIQSMTRGTAVDLVYNASYNPAGDLTRIFTLGYNGIPTLPSRLLVDNWMKFHRETIANPNAIYLQIMHSKGAIDAKLALFMLPPEVRNKIVIIAVAPGAIISPELCRKVITLASARDFVPLGERFHALLSGNPLRIAKAFCDAQTVPARLTPHPDAEWFDHSFTSPTLRAPLRQVVEEQVDRATTQ